MGGRSLPSYPSGSWTSVNRNGDVRRLSIDSRLDPTEAEQSDGVEKGAPFVSHVSQQGEKSESRNDQSDCQNEEKIPSSEHNDLQSQITQSLPSLEQKESESQTTDDVSSFEQRGSQSQKKGVGPSEQENSQTHMTDAVRSSEQDETQNQTVLADEGDPGGSVDEGDPGGSADEGDPGGSADEGDPGGSAVEGDPGGSAAGSEPLPNTTNEDLVSISSQRQGTSAHSLMISQNDRGSKALARLQLSLRGLSDRREALLGMRVKAQEDRKSMRHKQSALAELNARVLQDLQKRVALEFPAAPAAPLELLIELQEALEDLQVSAAEFDPTEDLLNRKEWELKEAEIDVYQSSLFEQAESTAGDGTPFTVEEVADTASNSTVGAQPDRSPLDKQYLSLKGDAQILNEELDRLRAERAYLVEEDRARRAMGRSLDPESQKFLDDFDVRHNQLQQDLFYVQEDIFRLQTTISNQSDFLYTASHFDSVQGDDVLLNVDVPLSEDFPLHDNAPASNVAPFSDQAPLADHGRISDPLLLSADASSPRFSTVSLDVDERSLSTIGYINEWLLHRLRRSSLEILRFKSFLRDMQVDAEQLKTLVLEWWPNDEMPIIYSEAWRRSRRSLSFNPRSGQPNISTQTRRSDSVIFKYHRLAQRSQRGAQLTSRDRSSATLDHLINNLTLHRPSTASSL